MKVLFSICLCVLLFASRTFPQKGVSKTPGGARYKIVSSQNGRKIEVGHVITVNFKMLTEDGKILYSSYENGDVHKLQVRPHEEIIDLMEVFVNLRERDSAIVYVPSDSIYQDKNTIRPEYLPAKSTLVFVVKIEKVQTVEEVIAEEKLAFDREREQLQNYLKENHLEPQATRSGLLYVITKFGDGLKPAAGDTIYMNYVASSVGGNIFDTNIEAEAQKAGLKFTGRQYKPLSFVIGETGMITPWDEAVLMLDEGAKAKFIIPSFLAFGPRGLGKIVKPYTTFIIDLEIVKIQKPLVKNFAEKHFPKKVAPQKSIGFNYLPQQVVKNLSSFLILMNDPKIQEGRTYNVNNQVQKQWYLIWWNKIIQLFK